MTRSSQVGVVLAFVFGAVACAPTKTSGAPNEPEFWKSGWNNVPGPSEAPPAGSPPVGLRDPSIADLLAKAEQEAAAKRYDDARITLRQVTWREKWHLTAHERYQDIMLQQNRFAACYAEFLDLLSKHDAQGEALYLFMRVTLTQRKSTRVTVAPAAAAAKAGVLYNEANALLAKGKQDSALHAARAAAAAWPLHVGAHRLVQDLELALAGEQPKAQADIVARLESEYAKLLADHEVEGDARYLFERIASLRTPRQRSLIDSTLRCAKDIAQDLPGYWLYYGFARLAVERSAAATSDNERTALLKLAASLYGVSIASDELVWEGYFGRAVALEALGKREAALEDYRFAIELEKSPDAGLLLNAAECELASGNESRAAALARRGTELYADDAAFWVVLGRAAEELGTPEARVEAVAAYKAALLQVDRGSETARFCNARLTALGAAK